QPGAAGSVETDSSFMIGVDWRNGQLVTSHHGTLAGDGFVATKSLIDLFDAPTSGSPSFLQEIDIDPGPGVYTYYSAAALDSAGHTGITYLESASPEFVSMYVAVHSASAPAGTWTSQLVRTDNAFMADSFRAGDYSTATTDPTTGGSEFWLSSEYSPATL